MLQIFEYLKSDCPKTRSETVELLRKQMYVMSKEEKMEFYGVAKRLGIVSEDQTISTLQHLANQVVGAMTKRQGNLLDKLTADQKLSVEDGIEYMKCHGIAPDATVDELYRHMYTHVGAVTSWLYAVHCVGFEGVFGGKFSVCCSEKYVEKVEEWCIWAIEVLALDPEDEMYWNIQNVQCVLACLRCRIMPSEIPVCQIWSRDQWVWY